MGCRGGCGNNACSCNAVPIPYYEEPCYQQNQSQGCQIFNQYSPVIRVSTGWAVPEADEIITLKVSALADMIIGATISNPIYGDYNVVAYDAEGQLIKVVKAPYNDELVGTPIPSCTKFLVTATGILAEDIAELQAEIVVINSEIDSLEAQIGTINTDIDGLEDDIAAINLELTFIEGNIIALQGDVSTLQGNIITIQGDITAIQGDVGTLQGQVSVLEGEMDDVQESITNLNEGWVAVTESWSYDSSSTVTVPSGAVSRYQKGDRLRFVNNSVTKYFVVVAIADTLLTLRGDAAGVTNSSISAIYFSRAISPFGYPDWFEYTPTFAGFSVNPSDVFASFKIDGTTCTVVIRMNTPGTSDPGTGAAFIVALPAQAATITNAYWGTCCWQAINNGVTLATPANAYIGSSATEVNLQRDVAGAAWATTGTKAASFTISYQI